MVGLNREAAARFSFLLGLPAIFGSGLYELKELIELGISSTGYLNLAVGISASFVTGYLSIELLLRFLRNHGTLVFVIYRIVIGTGILLFLV
jgi:undecaprenyl-diphosphatase